MKRVAVRFLENFFYQGLCYEKGSQIDALRVPKRSGDDVSFYLILGSPCVFHVGADVVEEISWPQVEP